MSLTPKKLLFLSLCCAFFFLPSNVLFAQKAKLQKGEDVRVLYLGEWRDGVVVDIGKKQQYLINVDFGNGIERVFTRPNIRKLCEVKALDFARKWRSSNGSFEIVAALKDVVGDKVFLITEDMADPDSNMDNNSSCMSCLVAVARLQPTLETTIADAINSNLKYVPGAEFSARLSIDGKFTYIDQRITTVLGYLPNDLIGSSFYENVAFEDIPMVANSHRNALSKAGDIKTKESFHR